MLQAFTGKVLVLFLSLWEVWMYYQFLYATCIEKTQLLKWQRVVIQMSIWSIGILFTTNSESNIFFTLFMFLFGHYLFHTDSLDNRKEKILFFFAKYNNSFISLVLHC